MRNDAANLAQALAEAMKHHQRNEDAGTEAQKEFEKLQNIVEQAARMEKMQNVGNSAMDKPLVAQSIPYFVDVDEGRSYKWCACGRSANQPFCDGSHAGTGIEPVSYIAETTRRVLFCGCKATKRRPICDGSHNSL
jgi:CDGSH-type Zn-finger protein